MPLFPFASCVPFGRRARRARPARPDVARGSARSRAVRRLARIEALLGLDGVQALRYVDGKRGLRRTIALDGSGESMRLRAFLLAGQTDAEPWLRALLVDEQPAQSYGRGLLRAGAAPPGAVPSRSPQVCTCHDVNEARIRETLRTLDGSADTRLAKLQQRLRCGTSCGSCLPALRRWVAEVRADTAAASLNVS